jgi:poly-gamma-glutamate synthase PgsB/CapB
VNNAGGLPKIDSLRERLAAPELAQARTILGQGGVFALLDHASAALGEIAASRARFEELSRVIEGRAPAERRQIIEGYLRASTRPGESLKEDLEALHGPDGLLDPAALGERTERMADQLERVIEMNLALMNVAVAPTDMVGVNVKLLMPLAKTSGRWSRRVEALALIGQLSRADINPANRTLLAVLTRQLAARTEHRWVQPAALDAFAAANVDAAHEMARERLTKPDGGDDFLVRARIVELIPRYRNVGWSDLMPLAWADPSDLVRLTAANIERELPALESASCRDSSYKVRAAALIAFAKRADDLAEPAMVYALANDTNDFVVQTAAEELVALVHRGKTPSLASQTALQRAAERVDLGPAVRTGCADALAEIDVLSNAIKRSVYDALVPIVDNTPVGGSTRILGKVFSVMDDDNLGRVLTVLARADYALSIDRIPEGLILYRGEPRKFAFWRFLFELRNPTPSKRQAFIHTWGRKPRGSLRSPPGGLAELTATQVPGERVLVERSGGWGRHLPLVDDLLATGVFTPKPVAISSAFGITRLRPPAHLADRAQAWLTLSFRYAALADLRRRALDSDEPATQLAYVNEVTRATGIALSYAPHAFGGVSGGLELSAPTGLSYVAPPPPPPGPRSFTFLAPGPLSVIADRFPEIGETWHDLTSYAASSQGNRLPELAAYVLVVLGAMMARAIVIRRAIEHDRRAIPLVIGGWGTRGKSGTERLKAGLFQGLGHETLVKTTGCEAMFIHSIPGMPAREVFIYRPYDKATVWEQRDVLGLGRRFGARVFLYECMALQPDLVNLIQAQWMRDDMSTLTNAYPDHEDVQGPAGFDVATTISEFIPTKGMLFTSEDQMLPILAGAAKERGTTMRSVPQREAELISDDLLKRFPYQEHPRNIALVTSMARALGIPPLLAIVEMADNVVPDLGVLKTYPTVPWLGRQLTFSNGMSANERTGALANWRRTGFDKLEPDTDPKRWVVTVVNNRGDRIARSEVFARFLVEDIGAHRHILIGSNVGGLVGFIRTALDRHILASSPTHNLAGSPAEAMQTARSRLDRAFAKVKVGKTTAASVIAECAALGFPQLDPALVERLLAPSTPAEPYDAGRRAVESALANFEDAERRPYVVSMIARRRAVIAIHQLVTQALASDPKSIDRAFGATYRALFNEGVVPLVDYALTGDQIIDIIAKQTPPGAQVSIMGVQNIKGTGLDFVYRWVGTDMVAKSLDGLKSPTKEQRERALRALLVHDDYGLVDASLALSTVEEARDRDTERATLPYEAVVARLRDVVAMRTKKLTAKGKASVTARVRKLFGETFDYLDSIRRQRMARDVVTALVAGRMSHAMAAVRMREIVARAKGQWMVARAS